MNLSVKSVYRDIYPIFRSINCHTWASSVQAWMATALVRRFGAAPPPAGGRASDAPSSLAVCLGSRRSQGESSPRGATSWSGPVLPLAVRCPRATRAPGAVGAGRRSFPPLATVSPVLRAESASRAGA